MVMKVRLRWYDKHSNYVKADEYSADVDESGQFF